MCGSDTDPGRGRDANLSSRRPVVARDPKSCAARHVPAVEVAVNGECFAQAGGSAAEIEQFVGAAPLSHDLDASERFQSPDENGRGDSAFLRDGVQAVPRVDRVDVREARRPEHRGVLPRSAAKRMRRGILVRKISFRFDDPPAAESVTRTSNNDLAKQLAGDQSDVAIVETSRKCFTLHRIVRVATYRHRQTLTLNPNAAPVISNTIDPPIDTVTN